MAALAAKFQMSECCWVAYAQRVWGERHTWIGSGQAAAGPGRSIGNDVLSHRLDLIPCLCFMLDQQRLRFFSGIGD